ncbi:hypothetical protein OpiT1DRAFT_04175 [Opitutaceae bacterium TAV1]|nr:hypothetical protein OpiT1DRAFT_04175 [Opitutaceae bacterium TAV1]
MKPEYTLPRCAVAITSALFLTSTVFATVLYQENFDSYTNVRCPPAHTDFES